MNTTATIKRPELTPQQLVPYRIPPPPDTFSHRVQNMRLVDFRCDPKDWGVPFLAAFGMNRDVIAQQTGLSKNQVAYRLSKLNRGRPLHERISAKNYRNGSSPVAQMVIDQVGCRVKTLLAPVVSRAIAAETGVVNV